MPPPAPSFTRATPTDADAALKIIPLLHADLGLAWDDTVQPAVLHDLLLHPEQGQMWLAHLGERLVGYALILFVPSLEFRGRVAFLDEFFMLPDQRGHGLGARFLDHLLKHLEATGIRAVRLEVDEAHPDAARLYSRHGFQRDPRELWTRQLR
jgi:GNAT superfamily N-acetyltransferase